MKDYGFQGAFQGARAGDALIDQLWAKIQAGQPVGGPSGIFEQAVQKGAAAGIIRSRDDVAGLARVSDASSAAAALNALQQKYIGSQPSGTGSIAAQLARQIAVQQGFAADSIGHASPVHFDPVLQRFTGDQAATPAEKAMRDRLAKMPEHLRLVELATMAGTFGDGGGRASLHVDQIPAMFRKLRQHPEHGAVFRGRGPLQGDAPGATDIGRAAAAAATKGQMGNGGGPEPNRQQTAADALQMVLDAVGVVEPTPFADATNAGISLFRAVTDKQRRGEHLRNAAISAAGMIPYVGDTAKLLKAGRYAQTARDIQRLRGRGPVDARHRGTARGLVGAGLAAVGIGGGGDGGRNGSGGGGGGGNVTPGAAGDDGGRGDSRRSAREIEDERKGREKVTKATETFKDKAADAALKLGGFVVSVVAAIEGLRLFNAGVIAINRDLAMYNGGIAVAYGRYEADEIRRKQRRGEAIEEPLSELIENQSRLQDARQRFTDPIERGALDFEARMTRASAVIVDAADKISGASMILEGSVNIFSAAMEAYDPLSPLDMNQEQKGGGPAWQQFFADVSDGKFDGKRPVFDERGRQGSHRLMSPRDHRDVFGD